MSGFSVLNIDFEGASTVDLRKTGAHVYAESPETRIICMAWAFDDNPVSVWSPFLHLIHPDNRPKWSYEIFPEDVVKHVRDRKTVKAWNAHFEYLIWKHCLTPYLRVATRYSPTFPDLAPGQLIDTMAEAACAGLPLGLDAAAEALPRLGIRKDKTGTAVMKRMARPRVVSKDPANTPHRWWHEEDPDKLATLLAYCKQDVAVERAIGDVIPRMSDRERRIWEVDFHATERGVKLDRPLTEHLKALAASEVGRLGANLSLATGGAITGVSQNKAIAEFIGATDGVGKDQMPKLLADPDILGDPTKHEVVLIRQEASKTSTSKLSAMLNYSCADGRMRGLTQHYGAFRTGRWAGRGPQVQNYFRPLVKDQDLLAEYLMAALPKEGLDMLTLLFGVTPLEAIASMLRGCLTVEKGNWLGALDFAQIEARVLAWMAWATTKLQAFRDGKDLYVLAASGMFHVPETEVDPDQRQLGKVAELALGFGGGVGAFQSMAKNYGMETPDDEADAIKVAWRVANPEIVSFWKRIEGAAVECVKTGYTRTVSLMDGSFIRFTMRRDVMGEHLLMELPSGRFLWYRDAELGTSRFGQDCVTYMGLNQFTRKWEREDTYGGKLTENATQAIARDVLAEALPALRKVLLCTIHDEVLLELDGPLPNARRQFEKARGMMSAPPVWAPSLPVASDGYLGKRFKK